jgi:succinate dehydrogenase/fumarate reductase flavoprotein subunit
MVTVCESEAEMENWAKWISEEGGYINNQEWSEIFATEGYPRFLEMDKWACPIIKDTSGKIILYPREKMYKILLCDPRKLLISIKKKAAEIGVKFIDRMNIVEFMKDENRVIGAYGFDLDSSEFRAFVAKETIIAHGSCNYKVRKLFTMNNGEGVMAAFNVGAEMLDAEFGNSYGYSAKYYDTFGRGHSYKFFINNRGEKIVDKYDISEAQDVYYKVVSAMGQETRKGNGPIWLDLTMATREEISSIRSETKMAGNMWVILPRDGRDPIKEKMEWVPILTGKQGAIRVDTKCKTSVDGLWAAGDAISLGSAWTGALAPGNMPGSGIPFAVVSGFRAGDFAARSAAEVPPLRGVRNSEINKMKEELFRPLGKKSGKDSGEAIYQIQEVVYPLEYNFFRREDRLKEGLKKIEEVKSSLPDLTAKDSHDLAKCHQARSMAVCAEMTFRAALLRTETRSAHIREDYPNTDNKNWLKWIVIRGNERTMELSTEPVPITKYRYKPEGSAA